MSSKSHRLQKLTYCSFSRVVLVEKRVDFTRHNILKLWKFLLADFKSLAVKKFIGKFCSGQINHVGIRTLQLFLAKVSSSNRTCRLIDLLPKKYLPGCPHLGR